MMQAIPQDYFNSAIQSAMSCLSSGEILGNDSGIGFFNPYPREFSMIFSKSSFVRCGLLATPNRGGSPSPLSPWQIAQ